MDNFYELLNLKPYADPETIGEAIRREVKVWYHRTNHPEIVKRQRAERILKLFEEAEEILLDPNKRTQYDQELRAATMTKERTINKSEKEMTQGAFECSRCGLKQNREVDYCPACGVQIRIRSQRTGGPRSAGRESVPRRTVQQPIENHDELFFYSQTIEDTLPIRNDVDSNTIFDRRNDTEDGEGNLLTLLGWRKLVGTVIAIDQPYQAVVPFSLMKGILKLTLSIFLIPLLISILVGLSMFKFIFSWLYPSMRGGGGSSFLSQFMSFFLYGSLFGPRKMKTVRDIRVRDSKGQEYLVRIQGDFAAGNVNLGDEIVAEGWNRSGTLLLYRGLNKRTNTKILIRRR